MDRPLRRAMPNDYGFAPYRRDALLRVLDERKLVPPKAFDVFL